MGLRGWAGSGTAAQRRGGAGAGPRAGRGPRGLARSDPVGSRQGDGGAHGDDGRRRTWREAASGEIRSASAGSGRPQGGGLRQVGGELEVEGGRAAVNCKGHRQGLPVSGRRGGRRWGSAVAQLLRRRGTSGRPRVGGGDEMGSCGPDLGPAGRRQSGAARCHVARAGWTRAVAG